MDQLNDNSLPDKLLPTEPIDPAFAREMQQLHELTVFARWMTVGLLWLTIGILSLWSLRSDIQLVREYFTWTAIRYALAFNRWAALGLGICVGMTVAVLLWQSRNIVAGVSQSDQDRLKQQVLRIRQQGKSHPLWKWIHRS